MKLTADIDGYMDALKSGALKGAAFGLVASAGLSTYLHKRTSFFRGAGGYQKVFVYAVPAAFCTIVNMENSSRAFEATKLAEQQGTDKVEQDVKPAGFYNQFSTWLAEYKYPVIVSGWAASLAGSFWLVNRDKYMTKSQKVVQARVYAQGLTVAMLIASVLLSVSTDQTSKEATQKKADYQSRSWERDIQFVETANHPHGKLASQAQKEESEAARAQLDSKKAPNKASSKQSEPKEAADAKENAKEDAKPEAAPKEGAKLGAQKQ